MKQLTKFLTLGIIMFAFTASTFGQATASATATIVAPIAINKTVDMNFGNVLAGAGTVILDPAGVRSPTGAVTLPATTGTVTAASFNVTGQANWTYSITLPAGATTISDGAAHTMTVDSWTSNPTVIAGGTLNGSGAQTLTVGATLNVAAGQAAGVYSSGNAGGSGDFTVTVNYN